MEGLDRKKAALFRRTTTLIAVAGVLVLDAGCTAKIRGLNEGSSLTISPSSQTLAPNNTFTFSAEGGTPPLIFSITAGSGNIDPTHGIYTAPETSGNATVTVTDSLGNTSSAAVTIGSNLKLNPATATVSLNTSYQFVATGGAPPYTYSVVSGAGTIGPSSSIYLAPSTSGTTTVRVTDSVGSTSDSVVTITNINATLTCPTAKTTYFYVGFPQSFTVPAGVTSITAKAWGAGGGGGGSKAGTTLNYPGGAGGFARATIVTTPGENLTILVGGGGQGGFPDVGQKGGGGGGGGDLSGIQRAGSFLIVAGGGGGGGGGVGTDEAARPGGAGGGDSGTPGGAGTSTLGGRPGTASSAGAGGSGGTMDGAAGSGNTGGDGGSNLPSVGALGGSLGYGGSGGASGNSQNPDNAGGGGGGGYFGGGGGSAQDSFTKGGGGGGGGSGFVTGTSTLLNAASAEIPANNLDPDYAATTGKGGGQNNAGFGSAGGNGHVVLCY